jgi:stomatin
MQIRYLEAMQAMAKSANSKVIFLPGASQGMPDMKNLVGSTAADDTRAQQPQPQEGGFRDFGGQDSGLQQAINSRVIETI